MARAPGRPGGPGGTGEDYRRHFLRADAGQAVVGIGVVVVATLFFLLVDRRFVVDPRHLLPLAVVRLAFVAVSLAVVPVLLRTRDPRAYEAVVALWALACVAMIVYTDSTRPLDFVQNAALHVLVVLGAYVILPNRLVLQTVTALLLTVIDLYLLVFVKRGLDRRTLIVTVVALVLANVLGAITSTRLSRTRRRQYDAQLTADRLRAELEVLATTDALTGLLNRRRFVELAQEAEARFLRYGRPFALLVADLDHFKAVNDRFGHQAGDDILREFGRCLATEMRDSDAAGRIGGEEFALLLPETDADGARRVAERVRQACRRLAVTTPRGAARVSVSVGAAEAAAGDRSFEDVMQRADRALYEAKARGRDRVEVA